MITITGISSMATRSLLAELAEAYQQTTGRTIGIESVGGVEAARRVEAGEPFDCVFLASDAIGKLIASGRVIAGSRVDLVHSGVAVAVRAGAPRPDIGSADTLKQAVRAATRIGYSTGPSGVALMKLFERWGIAAEIAPRLVQAPPGVPVGTLIARGEVALGFQQLSELMSLPGIEVLGPLPREVQIVTTFSAGICAASRQPVEVRELIGFMASAATADTKRRHGMEPT
jgi:molybdate transport system substrate-binding protein